MLAAIIPARNEEQTIAKIIGTAANIPADLIVVVANGCSDRTVANALGTGNPRLVILDFPEQLGVDIPRSIGAMYAYAREAALFLFVDGDVGGDIEDGLRALVAKTKAGTDLALTNCYPRINLRSELARTSLKLRARLNRTLGVFNYLGLATPSHGPFACSRRLVSSLSWGELAIPPLMLVRCRQQLMSCLVAVSIPEQLLASQVRSAAHARLIADTICGDHLQALSVWEGRQPQRSWFGRQFTGYHHQRRFDIVYNLKLGRRQIAIRKPPGPKTGR